MYVKIDLDDERYCDGCPLLARNGETCGNEGWVIDFDHFDPSTGHGVQRYIRPQACIDASAEIDKHIPRRCTCDRCIEAGREAEPGVKA